MAVEKGPKADQNANGADNGAPRDADVLLEESGKRKLKGPPLLVWGKNGKRRIEEWFMRWQVVVRGRGLAQSRLKENMDTSSI